MELFKANTQWSTRPSDERFRSLQALYDATKGYAVVAQEATREYTSIRAEAINGDVQLIGRHGNPARLTHWAFGQMAQRIGAPAAYLRGLPATLAVQNLNHGLSGLGSEKALMLFHRDNSSLLLRAVTSERYARIWNHEVVERLLALPSHWEPAVPDVRAFNGAEPSLYASDHDMFVFLRSRNTTITEPGTDQPIYRGVIVENSEVGASALKLTRFLYRYMCGNHIIWGASEVVDMSVRHVGAARTRWDNFSIVIRKWADESAGADEANIREAQRHVIAATKEQVLDAIFGRRNIGLSRKVLEASYAAVQPEDGDPRTIWGMVQGVTRHSQTIPFADQRTALDRAAGKLFEARF